MPKGATGPRKLSAAVAETISTRLSAGETLRKICRDRAMPSESSVYAWLQNFPEFREQYKQARERQMESLLEDLLEIADDPALEPADKKVRISTRQWVMERINRGKYGPRTLLGSDPVNPLPAPNDIELARLIVFQLTRAAG